MGKHPIRCRFMYPLRIALTLGQVAHATSGRTLRGRRGLWPFWAKRPKFTQKWSLEKSYLRITREMSLGPLHGCKPKLCLPFAIRVGVQSIMEAFLTPQVGRWVGALGLGDVPHGSPWRRPCDEQEEAPRVKRGGGLLPARPDCWPPTKRPRASPGGLFAASVTCLSRQEGVPPCLRTSPHLRGTLEVHRTFWRILFPRHACTFLVLGFRGAWVSHGPPRVPKQRRP